MQRIVRRNWFRQVGAAAMAWTAGCRLATAAETRPLRTIAYNTCGLKGWPSFAPRARRARADHGLSDLFARALAGYRPDVVTLAEAPDKPAVERIARQLGMQWTWFSTRRGFPGALLTNGEIVESNDLGREQERDLFTRHWGSAKLRWDDWELTVHSLHLHPNDARLQRREVEIACRTIELDLHGGGSVLVQGDSNHAPHDAQYDRVRRAGLVDSFDALGTGKGNTFPSVAPTSRIDYVWVGGPLAGRLEHAWPLNKIPFAWSLERGFALSDHLPWFAEFSG